MKVINTGLPEMLMFSINPAFDMLPSEEYVFDHFDSGFSPELFEELTQNGRNYTNYVIKSRLALP